MLLRLLVGRALAEKLLPGREPELLPLHAQVRVDALALLVKLSALHVEVRVGRAGRQAPVEVARRQPSSLGVVLVPEVRRGRRLGALGLRGDLGLRDSGPVAAKCPLRRGVAGGLLQRLGGRVVGVGVVGVDDVLDIGVHVAREVGARDRPCRDLLRGVARRDLLRLVARDAGSDALGLRLLRGLRRIGRTGPALPRRTRHGGGRVRVRL